jgi:hypothetical protein
MTLSLNVSDPGADMKGPFVVELLTVAAVSR